MNLSPYQHKKFESHLIIFTSYNSYIQLCNSQTKRNFEVIQKSLSKYRI